MNANYKELKVEAWGHDHCLPAMDGCVENCSRVLRQQNSMLKIHMDVDFKHRWGYGENANAFKCKAERLSLGGGLAPFKFSLI